MSPCLAPPTQGHNSAWDGYEIGAVLLGGGLRAAPILYLPSVTRAYTSVYFGIGILLHWQTNKFVFAIMSWLARYDPHGLIYFSLSARQPECPGVRPEQQRHRCRL